MAEYSESAIFGEKTCGCWRRLFNRIEIGPKEMRPIRSQEGEQFVAGMVDPSIVDAGETLPMFAVSDISY